MIQKVNKSFFTRVKLDTKNSAAISRLGASQSMLDRVQNHLRCFVGDDLFANLQPLLHRRNVTDLYLFYRYFHSQCSDELHSLFPRFQSFIARTRHVTSMESYLLYLILILTDSTRMSPCTRHS